MRNVDPETSKFADMVVDTFRAAVPVECAAHPFFAQVLKYDQTLYRQFNTRAARREAFLKVLFGDAWTMSDSTHPVDAVPAERATRCLVVMRLGIYNDLRDKAPVQQPGAPVGPPGVGGIQSAEPFQKAIRKILTKARAQAEGKVAYDYEIFRRSTEYQHVAGWLKLLKMMHEHELLETVEVQLGNFRPSAEALVDGEFKGVKRNHVEAGPGITLDIQKTTAFLAN